MAFWRSGLALFAAWIGFGCAGQDHSARAPTNGGVSYRYCAATVTEWEIHHCVFELTPEQQRRRGFSQRLVFENGKFKRYDEVNGLGVLLDNSSRKASYEYAFAGERVTGWTSLSRNGVVRAKIVLSDDGLWARWLDEKGRPDVNQGTRASGLRRKLDARGRVISYTYVDALGVPTPARSGVVEVRARRNASGALFDETYFDAEGNPMHDATGVHRYTRTLDAKGIDVVDENFDERGARVTDGQGVHRTTRVYDDVGNPVEYAFYGVRGERVRSKEEGAASCRITRDEHGIEISRTYFDENGKPTECAYGYVTRRKRLDAYGDAIEWSFFDALDRPMRSGRDRHAICRMTLDARHNDVTERYFDVDGRPMLYEHQYHRVENVYDARDNVVHGANFDEDGRPFTSRRLFAAWSYEYDGDRRVGTTYRDAADRVVDVGWGYARTRTEYDVFGIEGKTRYFDALDRAAPPPEECPPYDGDPVDLEATLAPLLTCAVPGVPPGVALSLSLRNRELVSAAYFGIGDPELRRCLEQALSTMTFPASPAGCGRAAAILTFVPPGSVHVLRPERQTASRAGE